MGKIVCPSFGSILREETKSISLYIFLSEKDVEGWEINYMTKWE